MNGNVCQMIPLIDGELPSILLPLFTGVKAGFPSPANDFLEAQFDLVKFLIPRPSSTFLMRVSGDSMINAGIKDGAIIIVDKSLKPTNKRVCVCFLDGEFTVKRLKMEKGKCTLHADNPDYPPIVPGEESNFLIWGAVTYAINPIT